MVHQQLKGIKIILGGNNIESEIVDMNGPKWNIDMFIKMNLETQYKADSSPAVIGDISTGGLFLLTLGATVAASEAYQFGGSFRLRYSDN